jgi:hypothetical protein
MASITTRAGKGAPLTNAELDANFTNLNTDKFEAPSQTGNSGKFLTTNGTVASWADVPAPNNGTLTLGVSGTGLSGSASFSADQAGNVTFTVASNATSANTAGTIVARDGSGNFSAGTITAALNGNAATATILQTTRSIGGVNFNGSANINLPGVNVPGNQDTTGSSASCTGNAATATALQTARTINGVSFNGTANITISAQATNTNTQLASLGVGTTASGTTGEIRATSTITSGFSDDRLKTKIGNIEGALDKVRALTGFYYEANETAQALGLAGGRDVGLSAQAVKAVQPEATAPAPVDEQYLTVRYERLVPLLVEAIKELDGELQSLKAQLKG